MILPQLGIHDVKSLVAPLEPLFDERAKHPVLLLEAIEKSANVRRFAKHAISYVDGTFIASHEPLFDERAKHPVLLLEAIEKSANVRRFAKHAISYVDGTFIASHDGPPREWISASHPHSTFHEREFYLAEEYELMGL